MLTTALYERLGRMARVVFGSGLASVLLLASNIVLARVLSPTSYGDYMTAFTLCNGGMFLATFGLPQLLLQEHGRKGVFSTAAGVCRGTFLYRDRDCGVFAALLQHDPCADGPDAAGAGRDGVR